jgi:hypothetical protein
MTYNNLRLSYIVDIVLKAFIELHMNYTPHNGSEKHLTIILCNNYCKVRGCPAGYGV